MWDGMKLRVVYGTTSYLTYAAKEGKKVVIVSVYRVCKQTNPGDITLSKQQLGIM
jgi:hypothetical protein